MAIQFSGKSNIVSSVVQAIKLHFEQYPLAIVNVKGRSKETTVQELVFKLEVRMLRIPSSSSSLLKSFFLTSSNKYSLHANFFFSLLFLQQETGSLLVSREPSNIILYRGWPADEPINAKNVNKMSKDRRITSNVSTGYTHRSRNTKRRISMIGRRRIGTRIGKRSIGRTSSRSNFNFRRNSSPIFSPSS